MDWFWFWFWFYYALWLASVFTLVLVLRQSSENRSIDLIEMMMMTRHGLMYWYFNDTNVLVNSNLYGTDTFANTNIICPSLRVACLVQSQIKENKKNGKYQLFH